MKLQKEAYIGDVTALETFRFEQNFGDFCFAGMGPTLHVYDLTTGTKSIHLIFSGARIHGIKTMQDGDKICTLMIYGDRYVQVEPDQELRVALWEKSERASLSHWILDGVLFHSANSLFIGLSNNSIEILSIAQEEGGEDPGVLEKLMIIQCSLQTFLFSMNIHTNKHSAPEGGSLEVTVASGTAFNDIFVWKFSLDLQKQVSMESVDPFMRLIGHSGGVLRIQWSTDGTSLLSASEDRTFAYWTIPDHNLSFETKPQFRSFGHKARIWDLLQYKDSIITCSEDCTFKVWSSVNGELLSTHKGHVGKGIWRCGLTPDQSLITAGADGGIFIWTGILSNDAPQYLKETEFTLQSSINTFRISQCWLNQIYLCPERGGVLVWQKSVHADLQGTLRELYEGCSVSGSFLCCSTNAVRLADDQLFELVVLGHSKGRVQVLLVNNKGELKESMTLLEANGKPVLTISSHQTQQNLEFLISSGDSSGAMFCQYLALYTNSDSILSHEVVWSFLLESPLKTRLICIEHFIHDGLLFSVAGDTHGSILAWTSQHKDSASIQLCEVFRSIHGKQPIGMVKFNPQRGLLYTAARNFSLQEYQIDNGTFQSGSVVRLRHISFSNRSLLIGGFCNREFCLLDLTTGQVLMKVDVGGRNRTHDFCLINDASSFAFASVEKQTVRVFTSSVHDTLISRGVHRCLHDGLHGDEINDVRLIQVGKEGKIMVLTASEDAHVKSTLFHPPTNEFISCKDVGVAAGGTSIKALTTLKMLSYNYSPYENLAESYLCVSAGSKQVLMTWKLRLGEEALEFSVVSVKPPERGGLRPSSTHVQTPLKSDLRFIAMSLIPQEVSLDLYLILSSSNASLTLHSFHQESKTWTQMTSLKYHKSPVLSLDHIKTNAPDRESEILVVSGSTDGTVCLWNLPHSLHLMHELKPICVHPQLHQSGVNVVKLCDSKYHSFNVLLISGGDDQSIAVVGVYCEDSNWKLSLLQSIADAHTSSVRDLVAREGLVFSIGLDQRLITWTFQEHDELVEEGVLFCEVPCPTSIDILTLKDTYLASNDTYLIIAGHGLQLLKCV
eukprot:g1292.t1